MTKKVEYNWVIGFKKSIKNSLILLVPFIASMLVGVPEEYAWISSPIVYFLKNLYETKTGKKI